MIVWPAKDPVEVLDFTWTVPVDGSDTISTAADPMASGNIAIDSFGSGDASITVWVSGGTADEVASVTFSATTSGGRTFREVAALPILDRASELLTTFRLRYPAFVNIDDGRIGYWLADAGSLVGASWPEGSRLVARAAYAAHRLAEAGALSGGIPAGVTSFRSGSFSATINDKTAALTGFSATVFGREFIQLRRATFAGPRLAWAPPVADWDC